MLKIENISVQARLAECEVTVESLNSKLMQLEKSKTQLQVKRKTQDTKTQRHNCMFKTNTIKCNVKKMQNMSIMKGAGSTLLVRDLVTSFSFSAAHRKS